MRLKKYLNEITASTSVGAMYEVPIIKPTKRKKFYKTDISPGKRSLKNLPRYSNKKPKCRFQDWLEIKTDSDFSKNKASGGKSSNGKWYGYSHRALHGFKKGTKIKNNDSLGRDRKRQCPYTVKDDNDAKWHAIRFSREVS